MKKIIAILLVLTTVFAISGCKILSADKPFAVMKAKTPGEETPDDGETAAPEDFESSSPEGYYGSQANTPAATIAWTVNNPYQIIFNKYNGFILPESSDRYLLTQDLQGLTVDELYIAVNEIAARHGASFSDLYLQEYFIHQSWYTQSQTLFNPTEIEKANTDLIYAARDMAMQSSDRTYWGADNPGSEYPGYYDPGYDYPGYDYPDYNYPDYDYPDYDYPDYDYPTNPDPGNQGSGNQGSGNQGDNYIAVNDYLYLIYQGRDTYCYHIPHIEIPGVNTDSLNQELYNKYYPYVMDAIEEAQNGYGMWNLGLYYSIGQKGDIISIVVHSIGDADLSAFGVYNIHASTGQRVSDEAVYAAFGTTKEEYREVMRNSLGIYVKNHIGSFPDEMQDIKDQCYRNTVADDNVDKCFPCITQSGSLGFVGNADTYAGAGWYTYMFNDSGNGYRIYCDEHPTW